MRILVLSDLHLTGRIKDKTLGLNIPKEYIQLYKSVEYELKNNEIDIVIVNGDFLDDLKHLTIQLLGFINSFFKMINDNKVKKIILMDGNHDILLKTMEEDNLMFSKTTDMFKLTKNVVTISKPKTLKVGSLNLHFIPYIDKKNVYKFTKKEFFGKNNVFFTHLDFDFIEDKLGIPRGSNTIEYESFNNFIQLKNRIIINGHYHTHMEFKDKNFYVVGGFPTSFTERIHSIKERDMYYGYMILDYDISKDEVSLEFKPYKFKTIYLKYRDGKDFLNEYDLLVKTILEDTNILYNIRVIINEYDEEVLKKIDELRMISSPNIISIRKINKYSLTQKNLNRELLDNIKENENILNKTDSILEIVKTLKESIKDDLLILNSDDKKIKITKNDIFSYFETNLKI